MEVDFSYSGIYDGVIVYPEWGITVPAATAQTPGVGGPLVTGRIIKGSNATTTGIGGTASNLGED